MSRIFSIGLIGDVTKPCAVGCVTDTFPPKRRCCVFCFILPWSLSFEQCFCARSTSFVPTQVHAHARCWKSTNNTWRAMINMIKHLRVCVVVVVFFSSCGEGIYRGIAVFCVLWIRGMGGMGCRRRSVVFCVVEDRDVDSGCLNFCVFMFYLVSSPRPRILNTTYPDLCQSA